MDYKDQLNRIFQLKTPPQRIVSLVPSQTELLCDLGLKGAVVGLTKFCIHPRGIKQNATVVGGTKQIHLHKIKALNPEIILCNKEENTKAVVEACESMCPVHVSDIFSIDDSLELINQYGSMFNKEKEANSLIDGITQELERFKDFIKNAIPLRAVYFIWKNPWMVAANNTFIHYLLDLNEFKNVYQAETRYPEINLGDNGMNENVQVVLLSNEPFPFKEKHVEEVQKYYPNAKVVLVDGEMFSWHGSRLLRAFEYFKNLRLDLGKNPVC